jgi:hypothetical protein
MEDTREWMEQELSDEELESLVEAERGRGISALEDLKNKLRQIGVQLLVTSASLKREEMILYMSVEGVLIGRGHLKINFTPEKSFASVTLFGFPVLEVEDISKVLTLWVGFPPHHRYSLESYEAQNRAYEYDKDPARAEAVFMNSTIKTIGVFDIARC